MQRVTTDLVHLGLEPVGSFPPPASVVAPARGSPNSSHNVDHATALICRGCTL